MDANVADLIRKGEQILADARTASLNIECELLIHELYNN